MAKHRDRRPIADKIAADIRALVMAGEWEPGSQVPSNSELQEQYGTSNMTVQRALAALKDEELLEGRSGSGVFVRDHATQTISPASYMAPSEPGEPYRWVSEAAERDQRGSNKILRVAEVKPPKRVAKALGLGAQGTAVLRSRIGLLNDEPAELANSYYPIELAKVRAWRTVARSQVDLLPCSQRWATRRASKPTKSPPGRQLGRSTSTWSFPVTWRYWRSSVSSTPITSVRSRSRN